MTRGFHPLHAVRWTAMPPPRAGADLHVHTTHSDGVCSPCEVVAAAAAVGLAALAITDHDTVSALAIARPEAQRCGVELIDGLELTCRLHGREVHLLGHFIHADDSHLQDAINWLQAGRAGRLETMADLLRKKSLVLDLETLRRLVSPGCPGPPARRRIPGAHRPGCQRARGVCRAPGRRGGGLRGQAAT